VLLRGWDCKSFVSIVIFKLQTSNLLYGAVGVLKTLVWMVCFIMLYYIVVGVMSLVRFGVLALHFLEVYVFFGLFCRLYIGL
jgi:hypothetical protein